jgi:hypothetical protein
VFYASIGRQIPTYCSFCKEYTTNNDSRADFVFQKGETLRAIEFLIKSSDVTGHHKRFEEGAYSIIKSYLVVDIQPWNKKVALNAAAINERLKVAGKSFRALATARRVRHAVFLVADDLSSGILCDYDSQTNTAVELMRSPNRFISSILI